LYDLSTAVDVLTSGKYTRLPESIKHRFIPPRIDEGLELDAVLARINDFIYHRLCTTLLPMVFNSVRVGMPSSPSMLQPNQTKPTTATVAAAVAWRDRSVLRLPKRTIFAENGCVELVVEREFKAKLTLESPTAPWTIVEIVILLAERGESDSTVSRPHRHASSLSSH